MRFFELKLFRINAKFLNTFCCPKMTPEGASFATLGTPKPYEKIFFFYFIKILINGLYNVLKYEPSKY